MKNFDKKDHIIIYTLYIYLYFYIRAKKWNFTDKISQ